MPSSLNHPNSRCRSKGGKKTYSAEKSGIYVSARKSYRGDLIWNFSYNAELQMNLFRMTALAAASLSLHLSSL